MSNENSTTNSPRQVKPKTSTNKKPTRRIRRGVSGSSGRFRKFSLITYLPEFELKLCIQAHIEQIRSWAYAYHDKDTKEDGSLKEPHYHLILVTHATCTLSAIRRWFKGHLDDKGVEITTTAQACGDVFEMYDYFTHSTPDAKADGKYQYDKSIIQSNDFKYFELAKGYDEDNILIATEELLKGANPRDLGKRYGRDFILHFGQIKGYINAVHRFQEHGMTVTDLVDREYEMELFRLNFEE